MLIYSCFLFFITHYLSYSYLLFYGRSDFSTATSTSQFVSSKGHGSTAIGLGEGEGSGWVGGSGGLGDKLTKRVGLEASGFDNVSVNVLFAYFIICLFIMSFIDNLSFTITAHVQIQTKSTDIGLEGEDLEDEHGGGAGLGLDASGFDVSTL